MIDFLEFEPEFWREDAACIDRADVDFFAMDDPAEIRRAKAICAGCRVLDDCLSFAIETNQPDGVWGGLGPKERSRLRRRWLEEFRKTA